MQDEKFCRKIIDEARKNIFKLEEESDIMVERPLFIHIPYSKKKYQRIIRLIKVINEKSEDFFFSPGQKSTHDICVTRKSNRLHRLDSSDTSNESNGKK